MYRYILFIRIIITLNPGIMTSRRFKRILGNGLLIALPLGIVLYILARLVAGLEVVIQPVAEALHIQKLLGELTLTILSVFVIILIVIFLGLLMQLPFVASFSKQLEGIAFVFSLPWRN